jgi:hypothetical protein
MRKTSLLLLVIFVAILSSCTPEIDPVETIINESEDTKQDIINILRLYLAETRELTVENTNTTDSDFTITFPFYKDDLSHTYQRNAYMSVINENDTRLYQILETMKDDLDKTEQYQEDTWKEITNSSDMRIIQYRLFINNRNLAFQYYYIGNENNIIGIYGNMSDENQRLEYTINTMEYFYQDDQFNKASQFHYKEGDIQYEKTIYHRPGGFDEITYTEYDYDNGRYKKIYLYDGEGEPVVKSVEEYNDDTKLYTEITLRHDDVQSTSIIQYDENNQIIHETNREDDYFNFEFNLLYVGGWYSINRYGSTNYLFKETGQLIVLSKSIIVNVKPEGGIYLTGYFHNIDSTTGFEVDNTELYLPLTYEDVLEIEDELMLNLDNVVNEAIEANNFIDDKLTDSILSILYTEEFYGMSKDLLE